MRQPLAASATLTCVFLGACGGPKGMDYSDYLEHFPRSILVLPPLNESLEVQASGVFLSTITTALAERGYYVIPVAVVDAVLKQEGVPLPPEMHQIPVAKLGEVFGADAVLYVRIKRWTTTYIVLNTTTTVDLEYRLVDVDTETEIWNWRQAFQYSPSSQQSSLIGMAVAATVHAAQSGSDRLERNVATAANLQAINDGNHGLLTGARHPQHQKDLRQAEEQQAKLKERQAKAAAGSS